MLNLFVAIGALVVLFGLWGGVHMLARRQIGDRKLGCRGPQTDEHGNTICCNSDRACDSPVPRRPTPETNPGA